MLPTPVKKLQPKIVDYLQERRNQATESDAKFSKPNFKSALDGKPTMLDKFDAI